MNLISIPALTDNYIWLLYNDEMQCLLIDPGEALSVSEFLTKRHLSPIAILLTHHHHDHTGGVGELLQHYHLPIYGPEETRAKGATHIVHEGDSVTLLSHTFSVMGLIGHTLGHIGFYSNPWLFCGDTMLSAGCGRLFEGTPKQMYTSFQKINNLPPTTLICSAHEYTLRNLEFTAALLPSDKVISDYQRTVKQLRLTGKPSLPTTLHIERQINIFLRCHEKDIQNVLNIYPSPGEEWRVFAKLRKKKDLFSKGYSVNI